MIDPAVPAPAPTPVPIPDPPPAGISIRGGVGPTAADLDDLHAAARAHQVAAGWWDDALAMVVVAEAAIRRGELESPGTARAALDALAPLLRGPTSLRAGADRARSLAAALRSAAGLYGQAEDRVAQVMAALLAAAGEAVANQPLIVALEALVVARFVLTAGAVALGWRLLRGERIPNPKEVAAALPAEAVMAFAGAVVRGLAPGWQGADPAPVPAAAGVVVAGTTASSVVVPELRRRPLRVTARLGATSTRPAPADAAGVLRDVGALYPGSGGSPGTVGVERLDRPDGSRAWVVAIPGTQTGGLGWGTNPMDMATNVRLMARTANDGTELVSRALAQAGVRPQEPVLLAGHSQGGMVAMALAGSAAFTARYTVAAVLTAGSPVGAQAVPVSTPVLHLENRQDLVPALDGLPSPAVLNRTTAVRDLRASSDAADRIAARDPMAAHHVDTYVRTAGAVSASGAPSVRAWEAAAGAVLGGGPGVRAVRMEFSGTRLSASGSRR